MLYVQYAMLLDVINSVVLHVEPARRRTLELRARMRFQLQLHRDVDPRRRVHDTQTRVRAQHRTTVYIYNSR